MKQGLLNYNIDFPREEDIITNREIYEQRFMKRYAVLESNIKLIQKVKKLAIEIHTEDNIILWNAFGFLNLLSYDLISVGYNLLFEKRCWQKVYFARQVALLMYEGSLDIPELLGKYFKAIFKEIPNAKDYISQLKIYNGELTAFRTENIEYLKNIRINVCGHRDHNIDNQLNIIQSINPYEIINLMMSFDSTLRKIMDQLQPLIIATIKPQDLQKIIRS